MNPGVAVGGASLWIVADKGDEQIAATWDFIKYLVDPQQQSDWAAATGYVPVRRSSLELDPIKSRYETDPRFAVAFEQLGENVDDVTANGPVIGPLREIRVVTGAPCRRSSPVRTPPPRWRPPPYRPTH